jgi:hypothetical protein
MEWEHEQSISSFMDEYSALHISRYMLHVHAYVTSDCIIAFSLENACGNETVREPQHKQQCKSYHLNSMAVFFLCTVCSIMCNMHL